MATARRRCRSRLAALGVCAVIAAMASTVGPSVLCCESFVAPGLGRSSVGTHPSRNLLLLSSHRGPSVSRAATADEDEQLKALQQLGIDPAQAKAMQAEVQKMMADPAKRKAMDAMQQQMQGKMAQLQSDPEMSNFFDDVRRNGLGAMQNYEKDERVMRKFNEAAAGFEQLTGAMGIPGVPPASNGFAGGAWLPGTQAVVQGLQARPELNGELAVILVPNAEERESLSGSGRVLVRLLSSGEQFAVKPENLRGGNMDDSSTSSASEAAAAAGLAGEFDAMDNDPELRPMVEDIRQNGMAAFEKYMKDEVLMAKIHKAMGIDGTASATA